MNSLNDKVKRNSFQRKYFSKGHQRQNILMGEANPLMQDLTPWANPLKYQASMILPKNQEDELLYKNFTTLDQIDMLQEKAMLKPNRKAQIQTKLATIESTKSKPSLNLEQQKASKDNKLSKTFGLYKDFNSLQLQGQQRQKTQQKKATSTKIHFRGKAKKEIQLRKIASFAIQWDEDILYNPEKKYHKGDVQKNTLKNYPNRKQSGPFCCCVSPTAKEYTKFIKSGGHKKNRIPNKADHQTDIDSKKKRLYNALQKVTHFDNLKQEFSDLLVKVNKIAVSAKHSKDDMLEKSKPIHYSGKMREAHGLSTLQPTTSISQHRKFRSSLKSRRVSLEKTKNKIEYSTLIQTKNNSSSNNANHHPTSLSRSLRHSQNHYSFLRNRDSNSSFQEKEKEIINRLSMEFYNQNNQNDVNSNNILPFQVVSSSLPAPLPIKKQVQQN